MYNKLLYLCSTQSKWYTFELFFGILLRYHLQSSDYGGSDVKQVDVQAKPPVGRRVLVQIGREAYQRKSSVMPGEEINER